MKCKNLKSPYTRMLLSSDIDFQSKLVAAQQRFLSKPEKVGKNKQTWQKRHRKKKMFRCQIQVNRGHQQC